MGPSTKWTHPADLRCVQPLGYATLGPALSPSRDAAHSLGSKTVSTSWRFIRSGIRVREQTPLDDRGTVFASLWATGHLFHTLHQGSEGAGGRLEDLWLVLPLVAALVVLMRPSSPKRLAVLAVAQLTAFAVQMPIVANHWLMAAFVNAGILVAFSRGRLSGSSRDLVTLTAPYARGVFLISYTAAGVAKLNQGFLDSEASCIVAILDASGLDPSALGRGAPLMIAISVIIELSVPLLLLSDRTRKAGVAVAVVFHLALALPPAVNVMDYSMLLFALLWLFMPVDAGSRVRHVLRSSPLLRRIRNRPSGTSWPKSAVGASALTVLAVARSELVGELGWTAITTTLYVGGGVLAVAIGLSVLASYRQEPMPVSRLHLVPPMRSVGAMLLVLLAFNVSSPYLGGKTTSSFTMFSNLRTEGGTSNHMFLPRLNFPTKQDDLVEIHDTSNSFLGEVAAAGHLVAYHEVRRALSVDPSASIAFTRKGEFFTFVDASDEPDLVALGVFQRKLFHYRTVNVEGPPVCQP